MSQILRKNIKSARQLSRQIKRTLVISQTGLNQESELKQSIKLFYTFNANMLIRPRLRDSNLRKKTVGFGK